MEGVIIETEGGEGEIAPKTCCNWTGHLKDLSHHLQFDCNIHEIPCKYHALLGCKIIVTPLTQEIHEKEGLDIHLSMAVEQLSQMRDRVDVLTNERPQMKAALRQVTSLFLLLSLSLSLSCAV